MSQQLDIFFFDKFSLNTAFENITFFYSKYSRYVVFHYSQNLSLRLDHSCIYYRIPNNVLIKQIQTKYSFEFFFFNGSYNKVEFFLFKKLTLLFFKGLFKFFRKKLILKGLGLKLHYSSK